MFVFDPFAPLEQLIPRAGARAGFFPAADVTVGEGDMLLTIDLPGLTADDLTIEILDGHLSVRGERKRPEIAEGSRWAHAERGFGAFERRVKLPEGVDPDTITASMDNGVLSLIVPKPERKQPRTVEIRSAEQRELTAA